MRKCENCGISIPDRNKRFCSTKCYAAAVNGKNHHLWKGGVIRRYLSEFNEDLKENIRRRDGYICTVCGEADVYGRKLSVHHIDDNPNNNTPSNLITVCHQCHHRNNPSINLALEQMFSFIAHFREGLIALS
jgi:5-methylcytosine-specific restriction endonuclease McrA